MWKPPERIKHPVPEVRWPTAEHWMEEVLRCLVSALWPRGVLLNVNFPDVPSVAVTGIEVTRQGRRKIGGSMTEGSPGASSMRSEGQRKLTMAAAASASRPPTVFLSG